MYHRYGRHGSHAWKHLQDRKYVHRSTVLPVPIASTTTIVRVIVPNTTERVIVIIMPENGMPEETKVPDIQIFTRPGGQPTFISPTVLAKEEREEAATISSGDASLTNDAQWRALSDARAVKALTRSGKFVCIDRPRIETRIESLVDAYLEKIIANGAPTPGPQEYQTKADKYKEAYLARFDEVVSQEQEKIAYLYTPIEARLRELAIQDRNRYPSPWHRSFHQRDLAVIQVLLELDISLDCAQQELEKIHDHADIYERYYANPREEVRWPDQATF